ncbi:MAG: endolytic transglycosylase MltG [candidate division SR1 bacterium]|nr:endolytic transglycosylase MltG [candidate division SR1 bacterium]
MAPKKKKFKLGRRIVLIVLIFCIYLFTKNITLDTKITINQGESASKILNQLGPIEKLRVKLYIKTHNVDFSKLEAGSYTFSGRYTKAGFIEKILNGSEKEYLRLTILEGRSIYDIDEALTKKGYITGGDYIAFVSDPSIITKYGARYSFLNETVLNVSPLKSLEGFLYPDTYNVDKTKNIIDQLVYAQLENFNTKVRSKYENTLASSSPGGHSAYDIMILASILEKEERNNANKPTVAGIFLKRLEIGMALDADITLCYGLKTSYANCTPAVIGQKIGDKTNVYNTRAVRGLPPTPISNPTGESINAVINPQKSDYLYYLHDMKGNIHYGKTLEEHNANKAQYL